MRFIGRTKELATLSEAYAAESSAFIPIYGRRRVGKSESNDSTHKLNESLVRRVAGMLRSSCSRSAAT